MELPDLSRGYETFIPIPEPPDAWNDLLKQDFQEILWFYERQSNAYKQMLRETRASAPPTWGGYLLQQGYFATLRTVVSPLVQRLMAEGVINWYAFLVHGRSGGVPATPEDPRSYVHLRLALAGGATEADLLSRLPSECRMTQPMTIAEPPSLDGVKIERLAGQDVRQGWKLLGGASAWVLNFVEAHDADQPIPRINVAQLYHYPGNQLMVRTVGILAP